VIALFADGTSDGVRIAMILDASTVSPDVRPNE
jgi:hypothetical protein